MGLVVDILGLSYSESPLVLVRLVDCLSFSKLVELGDYVAPSVLVS